MKKFIFLLLAMLSHGHLLSQICAMGSLEKDGCIVDTPNGNTNDCVNPDFCHLSRSNEYFLPDDSSPTLSVRLYLHIMAHEDDPVTFPNFVEEESVHHEYLINNIERMNAQVFGGVWDGVIQEERCDGNLTGRLAIDTKIRFIVEDIVWHYGDHDDYCNMGNVCGNHVYQEFIEPNPQYDDGLNVIFTEVPDCFGGCGPAIDDELNNYMTINNAFTDRYDPNYPVANWKEFPNLGHEIGHSLGLHHPEDWPCLQANFDYGCTIHNDDGEFTGLFNHFMHGNSSDQRYVEPLEAAQMRRYLLTTWREKWLLEYPAEPEELIIDESVTWLDEDVTWYGDITIKSNAELRIDNSTLRMKADKRIFVKRGAKLIIDGGTITSCDERDWRGVIVEGAAADKFDPPQVQGQLDDPFGPTNSTYAGTVIMINGGTIDNAINGISTNNRQYPWSERAKYRGGLIYCDGANFTNCNRAVEFMPYGTLQKPDKSLFNNTTFTDLRLGVTSWSSDGVTFTQCHFENIERTAIGGYDAALNVYNGNDFINAETGVALVGTIIKANASQIGMDGTVANNFDSGDMGIWLSSVNNLTETNIQNNNFNGTSGILIDGMNLAIIEINDINVSNIGVIAFDSKNDVAIRNNEFTGNSTAIHTIWDNSDLTFPNNCMENTTYEDVWVYGDGDGIGRIEEFQGNSDLGAGNCFSKGLIPEIITDGNTQTFQYFVPEDIATTNCLNPEFPGNFAISSAQDIDEDQDCGSTGFLPDPPDQYCLPSDDLTSLISQIHSLDNELLTLNNQNGNLAEINQKERCLDISLRTLARLYAENGDFSSSNAFFASRPEFQMRLIPLSNYILKEDYTAARSYLPNLISTTPEENNFKVTANIYLDYLDAENYSLNSSDQLFLETTADNAGPLNGYARSVYYRITGNPIELSLPSRNRSNPPAKEDKIGAGIKIFPNPTADREISITGLAQPVQLELFDALGNRVLHLPANTQSNISLSKKFKGVYFIKLSKGGDTLIQEKLIIL